MQRKLDRLFDDFSQKIFSRDAYTCQFCGLQSQKHQEVINLDQDYHNNKLSNLVTACGFCTQCFFLESVDGYGGGLLIYLPEITQNHLNALCHVLFSAMNQQTEYKETAQNAYRHLKLRAQVIEDEWGEEMQQAATFGQLLIELEHKALLKQKIFSAVRLLPSRAGFSVQNADWSHAITTQLK